MDKRLLSRVAVRPTVTILAGASVLSLSMATVSFAADETALRNDLQIFGELRPLAKGRSEPESLSRAIEAMKLVAETKLPQASHIMNGALQLDARNSYLHFFNGLVYHLQARQGDIDKTETAIEGYEQAVRLDPNNWIAHEFLGLALMEQRQYRRAQASFAEVLLSRPNDAVALARMSAASYMAGDAHTACATSDRIDSVDRTGNTGFLRNSILIYAACGAFGKAIARRAVLIERGASADDIELVDQRLTNWNDFHKSRTTSSAGDAASVRGSSPLAVASVQFTPQTIVAQASGVPEVARTPRQSGAVPAPVTPSGDARMVLVDVVMVRTEDSIATTKGINLLSALTLQFGSQSGPAFSRTFNQTTGATGSTVLTRAISVPALLYSLNIANASNNLNEVLARPTLAAMDGQKSEFFSGTALNAAVVSSGSGSSGSSVTVEKKYGVKLTVLPQIRPDGLIRLSIDAARTFLKPPSSDIAFTYKLEISEILVTANVVMRMGDTLVLGGLSEKESTSNRDGVPGLQDTPGLQYFFSRQAKTDYQKSVLILITPRPASYTWLSDESKAVAANAADDPFTPSVDVLRARYSDWFKPYPNLASVFHHLNAADLYREFRTGDVTLQSWRRMDTTRQRLMQALGFLYF